MAASSPWPTIQSEREALLQDLEPLDDAAWSTPSLCEEWTVRDVVAHLTAAAHMGTGAFFTKLIGSGFSFEKVQAKGIASESGGTPADLLGRFREIIPSTTHPPGPVDTWLGETLV